MMDYLAVCFAVVLAFYLAWRLNLVERARKAIALSRAAGDIARNDALSDIEKEQQTQQAGVDLIKQFFSLFVASMVAFGAPLPLMWGISLTGLIDFDHVIAILSSWQLLVLLVVVFTLYWKVSKRG